ncbi:flagella basal body P-ring formation protein FlgA [Sulfitobacter brevis]|uniref:Flagella basal body P-ring formation protein FlgA n=1 Tax=Sulfitobacter brevis TaxID=74348 RepID=A0A1I2E141_9RHOB|nr:flagellar basal body P-ring formation chaperone FlgA [Sulfitobacter brevis]SFE86261.1 flagella basal body P-ring formation protein FlgA [Sulfitobacter brevis]
MRLVLMILQGLAAAVMLALPAAAAVEKVTDLVHERAVAELAETLPDNGRIEINLAEGVVTEGAFIQEFWMDPNSGQFIANVVSEFGEVDRVWGLAVMTVEVPVPSRRLLPDEIVQAADLHMVALPLQRLGAFAINDPADLVGQQVRRMLVAGRPVPRQSVIAPLVIVRGEKIKIVLRHGGLALSATGRAMEDAHKGQILRVVNLSSNKTISAVATGAGIVEVDQ